MQLFRSTHIVPHYRRPSRLLVVQVLDLDSLKLYIDVARVVMVFGYWR